MNGEVITITNVLIILATLLSPFLAVHVQKRIEFYHEKRNRKLSIFFNLMATRANRVSDRHVEALNSIQLEYYPGNKGKAKKVKDAWLAYHSKLGEIHSDAEKEIWANAHNSLFIDLLYEMSQYLGYSYNKVDIEKGVYFPIAHGTNALLQQSITTGLAGVLSGEKSIKIRLDNEVT